MRCDIHRAILDFNSSDSDGAVKPDHGGVLTPRLSEVVVEKFRSVAPSLSSVKCLEVFRSIFWSPQEGISIKTLFEF